MSDRASEVIREGDPAAILRMAVGAWMAAEEGRYCECDEPSLHGFDLMCGKCLLENEGQIKRRTARIRDPHPFELSTRKAGARLRWCEVCTMPEDDPRHTALAPVSSAGQAEQR